MKPEVRPAIAFIVVKLSGTKARSTVYDYSNSAYRHFSGEVGPRVAIYDHSSQAHITGTSRNLYHHGSRAHLSLSIEGNRFSGYDFDTHKHFSGSVRRNNVQLYDYGDNRFYQFLVT